MSPEGPAPFQEQQLAFTAHIRDPDAAPVPQGIEARRMAIYVELFFNNIEDQVATGFPVLRQITPDERWYALIRDFMRRHRSTTPLFTEVGLEFLDYLQNERDPQSGDWPFMLELAHYEYVELAVSISNADQGMADIDPNGDLVTGAPAVAPTAWNLSYRFPVHEIGPDYLPDHPPGEPTHLVVYRDRLDEVHFLAINAVSQRLIEILKENPGISGQAVLDQIATELNHPQPGTVIEAGRALLANLKERNVIMGTWS